MKVRYGMNVDDRVDAGKIHFSRRVVHYALVVPGPVPAERI